MKRAEFPMKALLGNQELKLTEMEKYAKMNAVKGIRRTVITKRRPYRANSVRKIQGCEMIMIKNKDIAAMLNLSPAAVSLARNGKPGVSEHTRKMVNELLAELAKKNEQTEVPEIQGSIAFVMHKNSGKIIAETQFFLTVTEVIQEKAQELGYHVIILQYNAGDDMEDFMKHLEELNICGIFLLATEMSDADLRKYKKIGLPILVLDSFFYHGGECSVVIDNYDGIFQVVEHAKNMGHHKIGFLRSRIANNNFKERYWGYKNALEELGLPFESAYVFEVGTGIDESYEDMKKILEEKRELPSILIAGNDILAIGAMRALKEFGKRIPEDISITGFDDMPVSKMMDPPLTSVKIHIQQFGEKAIMQMMNLVEEKTEAHFSVRIGCELMERTSVRDLRQE